jgi:hypothetical protein
MWKAVVEEDLDVKKFSYICNAHFDTHAIKKINNKNILISESMPSIGLVKVFSLIHNFCIIVWLN